MIDNYNVHNFSYIICQTKRLLLKNVTECIEQNKDYLSSIFTMGADCVCFLLNCRMTNLHFVPELDGEVNGDGYENGEAGYERH